MLFNTQIFREVKSSCLIIICILIQKSRCQNGYVQCSNEECLIDTNLMNQINNDPRSTWQAGNYSMFWGKTLDHGYRHRLGTRIARQAKRPLIVDSEPLQPEYDFRQEPFMEEIVRRPDYIRDQGDCAASWAFAALGKFYKVSLTVVFFYYL